VPLLGVLPGTGGLTRVTDKRRVRRDLADVFSTTTEGVRAERARQWGLVDHIAKPAQFADAVAARVAALAAQSTRPGAGVGIALTPLTRSADESGLHYRYVDVALNRAARTATLTLRAPDEAPPASLADIHAQGADWWPLALARELDDAILMLRTNDLEVGAWLLRTSGNPAHVLAADASLLAHAGDWLVKETLGLLRRTFARLDVSSRTMFALIDRDACFAGTLAELAFAADRSFMLSLPDEPASAPTLTLSAMNFGPLPMVNHQTRLLTRFCGDATPLADIQAVVGEALNADRAIALGLVTYAPDDIDWDDEVRLAIEERASLSPDALTGMEASLRFPGQETMETRIFGRLSAWQNWIFIRPNAVGEQGALKVFGSGSKAQFNWERV